MPFFYSQYLRGDKTKSGGRGSQPRLNAHPSPKVPGGAEDSSRPPQPPILKPGPINPITGLSQPPSHRVRRTSRRYRPLKPPDRRKKVVHFATIEVRQFHFDWRHADDVFFTRAELTAMGKGRFDDAAALRQRRQAEEERRQAEEEGEAADGAADGAELALSRTLSADDVGTAMPSKTTDVAALMALAFEDDDWDEEASVRGIEHFVYPVLQQEMLRRKKQVQREVLEFARSNRVDPQGWRLAEHSRSLSQWARNVAMEKGVRYCLNNASGDPEQTLAKEGLERFKESQDALDQLTQAIKGAASFGDERETVGSPSSFEARRRSSPGGMPDTSKGHDAEHGPKDKQLLQPPGASTGEG